MKIAIFAVNMCIGGVERSLINYSDILVSQGHDIDLYLMSKEGMLLEQLSNKINIIEIEELKKYGKIQTGKVLTKKIFRKLAKNIFDFLNMSKYIVNKINQKYRNKKYDIAVVYQGLNPILPSFVVNCIDATKKTIFIHVDFKFNKSMHNLNKTIKKFDKIFTVSRSCIEPIIKYLHVDRQKVDCVHNLTDVNRIKRLINYNVSQQTNSNVTKFVTVGRLSQEKGIIRSLKVFKKLKNEGFKFVYTIVGSGPLHYQIRTFIQKNNMDNLVNLVGETNNPFVYMKQSDCLLLLSYQEAAPLVINECFCVGRPVLSTNTRSAREMIGEYGFVCDNDFASIYKTIKELLTSPEYITEKKERLRNFQYDIKIVTEEITNSISI